MKFELSKLTDYTTPDIIAELQRVAAEVPEDLSLTTIVFGQKGKVSASTVRNRFGSWAAALQAAGLSSRYSGRTVSDKMKVQQAREMSNANLLAELKRVADLLETRSLTQPQFNSHSEISATGISRRFGSWGAALKAAGLTPTTMGRRYSESDYFENMLNVWTHHGRQPTYQDMNGQPSLITAGGYEKRWGTWNKALSAFVAAINSNTSQSISKPIAQEKFVPPKPINPEDRRKIPLGLRYYVLRRDNFKCVVCGANPATDPACILHVDHIVSYSRGGKTVEANLRTLCSRCNIGKSNK